MRDNSSSSSVKSLVEARWNLGELAILRRGEEDEKEEDSGLEESGLKVGGFPVDLGMRVGAS